MSFRIPTPALAALALGALALDLSVAGTVAHGDDPANGSPAPIELPLASFAFGEGTPTAEVDGLTLTLERDAAGAYAFVATNPSGQDIDTSVLVASRFVTGSSMGRMGPMVLDIGEPRELLVHVPARGRAGFAIDAPPPDPDRAPFLTDSQVFELVVQGKTTDRAQGWLDNAAVLRLPGPTGLIGSL